MAMIFMTACGTLKTTISVNKDGSGKRVMTYTIDKESYNEAMNVSVSKVDKAIQENLPEALTYSFTEDAGIYKAEFTLEFDSIEDYIEKVNSFSKFEFKAEMSRTDSLFSNGVYYKENRTGTDVMYWFAELLVNEGFVDEYDASYIFYDQSTVLNIDGSDVWVSQGKITYENTEYIAVDSIDIYTTENDDGTVDRKIEFRIKTANLNKNSKKITEFLEAGVAMGAKSEWTTDGAVTVFTVSREGMNSAEVKYMMDTFFHTGDSSFTFNTLEGSDTVLLSIGYETGEYFDASAFGCDENVRVPVNYYFLAEESDEISFNVDNVNGKDGEKADSEETEDTGETESSTEETKDDDFFSPTPAEDTEIEFYADMVNEDIEDLELPQNEPNDFISSGSIQPEIVRTDDGTEEENGGKVWMKFKLGKVSDSRIELSNIKYFHPSQVDVTFDAGNNGEIEAEYQFVIDNASDAEMNALGLRILNLKDYYSVKGNVDGIEIPGAEEEESLTEAAEAEGSTEGVTEGEALNFGDGTPGGPLAELLSDGETVITKLNGNADIKRDGNRISISFTGTAVEVDEMINVFRRRVSSEQSGITLSKDAGTLNPVETGLLEINLDFDGFILAKTEDRYWQIPINFTCDMHGLKSSELSSTITNMTQKGNTYSSLLYLTGDSYSASFSILYIDRAILIRDLVPLLALAALVVSVINFIIFLRKKENSKFRTIGSSGTNN